MTCLLVLVTFTAHTVIVPVDTARVDSNQLIIFTRNLPVGTSRCLGATLFTQDYYCVSMWLKKCRQNTHLNHVKVRHIVSSRPHQCHTATIHLRPTIVKLAKISQPIKVRLIGNSDLANFHLLSFNFRNVLPLDTCLNRSPINQGNVRVTTHRIDQR